jgi:tetratricopeptide (TPR) repeat protein
VRSVIDSIVRDREREEQETIFDDALRRYNAKLFYCTFLKQVGDIYDQYGDYEAAYEMYEKCLSTRRFEQGMDHLDVAEACTDLGRTLFSLGSLLLSRDMYLDALRIREKHNSDPLNTACTYFHVGKLLREMGDRDEAMIMLRKCLAIQEDVGSNRDAAKTRSHIALLLGESDNVDDMRQGLEMAQNARRVLHVPGEGHPDTAFCFCVMATILQHSDIKQALHMIGRCQSIQEKVYGSRHPALEVTYTLHGDILRLDGRLEDALEQYSKALDVGTSPLATARTYAKMSVVASLLHRHDEAIERHDDVLRNLESSPQTMDQNLVLIYSSAGEMMFDSNEHDLAAALFRRGMEVMETMLGKDHFDTAVAHEALGATLYNAGDYVGALNEYKRSLTIKRATLGEHSPEVLKITQLVAGATTQWLAHRNGILSIGVLPPPTPSRDSIVNTEDDALFDSNATDVVDALDSIHLHDDSSGYEFVDAGTSSESDDDDDAVGTLPSGQV